MKIFKFIIVIVVILAWAIFLNTKINSYDLSYYYGKDDGLFFRIFSLWFSGSFFFLLLSNRNKFKMLFLGFGIGVAASIIAFLFWAFLAPDFFTGLLFHILGIGLIVLSIFLIEKNIFLPSAPPSAPKE